MVGFSSSFRNHENECDRLRMRVSYAVIHTIIRDFTLEIYDCHNMYWFYNYDKDLPNNALVDVSAKVKRTTRKLLKDVMVERKKERKIRHNPPDKSEMPIYGW